MWNYVWKWQNDKQTCHTSNIYVTKCKVCCTCKVKQHTVSDVCCYISDVGVQSILWQNNNFHSLYRQDISLTQWSAYRVLFRLNATLHHRVSQPICDTVCSGIMAISIHLVFIQIRADKQALTALRHTLNKLTVTNVAALRNLLHWIFLEQYQMLVHLKHDLKTKRRHTYHKCNTNKYIWNWQS